MSALIENRLQPSPTLRTAETARTLQSQGKKVIRFDIGEPDFDTPDHIRKAAVESINKGFTHYTSSKGILDLRAALAKEFTDRHVETKAENVVVFPGSKSALYASLSLLIEPDEKVIIPDPAWPSYASIITFLRGVPVSIPTKGESQFVPTIESFLERIDNKTKAVIINSPNNPTGAVYQRKLVEELRDLCEERKVVLVSDEIYASIVYDGERAPTPLADPESGSVIVISGFSKEYAMTGWRLDYAVASTRFAELLARFQENTTTCPTSFVQKAAVAALSDQREWFRDMLAEYRRRRDVMVRGINTIQGWECPNPGGAFYCFPRTNLKDSRALEAGLLYTKYVSVVAGAHCGSSGERHLRLPYAISEDSIEEGLGLIKQYVEEQR
jgi:aspartate aminotransferase